MYRAYEVAKKLKMSQPLVWHHIKRKHLVPTAYVKGSEAPLFSEAAIQKFLATRIAEAQAQLDRLLETQKELGSE